MYDNDGDDMSKRFLGLVVIAVFSGAIIGNMFYKNYEEEQNLNIDYNTYLLQLGVYDSNEDVVEATTGLEGYLVIEGDNKFYVYVGVSTKINNAEKVKDAFLEQDINVSIKKSVINDIEFMSNLEQFDILLDSASSNEDIMSINEVILSSYEEMVLSD